MSLQESTVFEEMDELRKTPSFAVYWRIEITLKVRGIDTKVGNVISQSSINKYDNNYYGSSVLTIQVDPVVHKYMLENQDDIQVELVKAQQSPDGLTNTAVYRYSQLFNAHIMNTSNKGLKAESGINQADGSIIEQSSNLVDVELQLVEPLIAEFRLAETGGVFTNVTLADVLRYTLGFNIPDNATKDMLEDPTYIGIRGVDVVPISNTRVYEHIVIENGTRLTDIPRYLHNEYGIYTSGLGWHIERGRCFIYPLFDYTQYGKRHKMLTVLNVPINEAGTMERTFLVRPNQLYVFSTGDTTHVDNSESVQQNNGIGIRYSIGGDIVDNIAKTSGNKCKFKADSNVKTLALTERVDGMPNIKTVSGRFTDNPYLETSALAIGLGTRLVVNWDNANPNLLYPGMPTKLLYKEGGVLKSLLGTLIGVDKVIAPATSSILDSHFITSCKLYLHIAKVPSKEVT